MIFYDKNIKSRFFTIKIKEDTLHVFVQFLILFWVLVDVAGYVPMPRPTDSVVVAEVSDSAIFSASEDCSDRV